MLTKISIFHASDCVLPFATARACCCFFGMVGDQQKYYAAEGFQMAIRTIAAATKLNTAAGSLCICS